jgi:DNA-binding response OmpR family regulator
MKRILIVEDDQFLIDAYHAKFSHVKDTHIDFAHDGNEAFQKIEDHKPDSIILDLLMPNADGFDFLGMMKDKNIHIPVLVASNLDSPENIKNAMDLGAKDYFIKSNTSIQEIVDKVTNLMKD